MTVFCLEHEHIGGAIIAVMSRLSRAALVWRAGQEKGQAVIGDGEIEQAMFAEPGKQT